VKATITLILLIFINISQARSADSLSLYLFLLDDCPICIQYTPTIKELYKQYGDRIEFVGYFPNLSSKRDKIENFTKTYGIEFPVKTDYFKTQAKKYKAEVTPEVVLYNHTAQKTLYQGRIDNMFYKLGRKRKVVTQHDLINAIENALQNKPIEKPFVQPVGCFINFSDELQIKNNRNN